MSNAKETVDVLVTHEGRIFWAEMDGDRVKFGELGRRSVFCGRWVSGTIKLDSGSFSLTGMRIPSAAWGKLLESIREVLADGDTLRPPELRAYRVTYGATVVAVISAPTACDARNRVFEGLQVEELT